MKLSEVRKSQVAHLDDMFDWLRGTIRISEAIADADTVSDTIMAKCQTDIFMSKQVGSTMLYLMEQIEDLSDFIANIGLSEEQQQIFHEWNELRFQYPAETDIVLTDDIFMYPESKGKKGVVKKVLLNGLLQCEFDGLGTVCLEPGADGFEEVEAPDAA